MSRKKQAPKRIFYPDAKYKSLTLSKFINFIMKKKKKTAAEKIIGSKLDNNALDQLAQEASKACKPINDKRGTIKFRTHVAGVLAKRTAKIAYDRARAVR